MTPISPQEEESAGPRFTSPIFYALVSVGRWLALRFYVWEFFLGRWEMLY
jgi:hypothetical protein